MKRLRNSRQGELRFHLSCPVLDEIPRENTPTILLLSRSPGKLNKFRKRRNENSLSPSLFRESLEIKYSRGNRIYGRLGIWLFAERIKPHLGNIPGFLFINNIVYGIFVNLNSQYFISVSIGTRIITILVVL